MRRPRRFLLLAAAIVLMVSAGCTLPPAAIAPAAQRLRQASQLGGKILYVREGNLWVWQADEARQLTTGGSWRQPAWSPDGDEIAYVYRDGNFSDVFAMAADGSATRRLTRGQSAVVGDNDWAFRPGWSRDGAQIAYISDADSPFPLVWVMNKDGSAKRQVMSAERTGLDVTDALSWAPDGKRLAVTAMGREPSQVYVLDIARGVVEKFTSVAQGAIDPAWSPDGGTIAYVAREGNRTELRLRRVDGGGEVRSDKLAHARAPAWSPDGRSLAVLSAQSGSFQVWVAAVQAEGDTLEVGDFRQLTHDGGVDAVSGVSWAR